jgi:hypothetical protein
MRESGLIIDKIIITTNPNYIPTGLGPAESPRGSVLPVLLLDYNVTLKSNGVVAVSWSTDNELNNDYFLIENSIDGITFRTMAKIPGESFSNVKKQYAATDNFPFKGLNYYRLSQVDKDGRKKVYGIKTVLVKSVKSAVHIYPNPLNDSKIYFSSGDNSILKSNVQLINMNGQSVFSGFVTGQQGYYKVDLKVKPPSGIYMIKVGNDVPVKLVVH